MSRCRMVPRPVWLIFSASPPLTPRTKLLRGKAQLGLERLAPRMVAKPPRMGLP